MSKPTKSDSTPNREKPQKPSGSVLAKSGDPEPDVDNGTKAGKEVVPAKRRD